MSLSELIRLARLKTTALKKGMYADISLEHKILKEVIEKSSQRYSTNIDQDLKDSTLLALTPPAHWFR